MTLLSGRDRRPADGEAHAAGNRLLRIVGVGDDFNGRDAQVDSLRRLLGSLLLGRGNRFVVVLVDLAWLDLAAHGARVDDRSLDGAQQSVGERGQSGRGGRVRLHLRAPCAQQKPQQRQRQPDDALRVPGCQSAKRGYPCQRHQHQAGPQPEPVGQDDSQSEEPGGMKERDGAQPLDQALCGGSGKVLPGVGGFRLHCA